MELIRRTNAARLARAATQANNGTALRGNALNSFLNQNGMPGYIKVDKLQPDVTNYTIGGQLYIKDPEYNMYGMGVGTTLYTPKLGIAAMASESGTVRQVDVQVIKTDYRTVKSLADESEAIAGFIGSIGKSKSITTADTTSLGELSKTVRSQRRYPPIKTEEKVKPGDGYLYIYSSGEVHWLNSYEDNSDQASNTITVK